MAISRSQLVKELEPGLNALFGLEYKRYENQHAEIYTSESSDRAFEEEVMLAGFSNAAVKPEGQGVTFDDAQETFTARYTNETIATVSLSYNAHQPFRANRYTCENGSLELDGKIVRFNGEVVFETPENPEGGVVLQNREFIDAIRENRQPSCNADDALRALRPLQQVYDQMVVAEGDAKYKRPWNL